MVSIEIHTRFSYFTSVSKLVDCVVMSFIGSSEQWGDQAVARLCQVIMEANDGMVQQIIEDRTDWLDLLSKEELERTDDLGLSLAYLVVYYDKPEAVKYLHKRGIDFSKPCDPVGYGTPMYYAITMGKVHIVETLNKLGYSLVTPCETVFQKNAVYYAERRDDYYMLQCIEQIRSHERRAYALLRKNFFKLKERKLFLKKKKAAIKIQKIIRGKLARIRLVLLKIAEALPDEVILDGNGSLVGSIDQMSTVLEGEEEGGLDEEEEDDG